MTIRLKIPLGGRHFKLFVSNIPSWLVCVIVVILAALYVTVALLYQNR